MDEKVFDRDLQMALQLSKEVSEQQDSKPVANLGSPQIVVHSKGNEDLVKGELGKENEEPPSEQFYSLLCSHNL
jgi:hypothetical protein